jgi:hypothetical protein
MQGALRLASEILATSAASGVSDESASSAPKSKLKLGKPSSLCSTAVATWPCPWPVAPHSSSRGLHNSDCSSGKKRKACVLAELVEQ